MINSCIKLFLEYFSSLVQYSNILPVFVLQFFLFCIIVSNVGKKNTKTTQKKEFFEVYRVLWVLEFVETDLEDQHLRIKIFYIYNILLLSFEVSGFCFFQDLCLLPPLRSILPSPVHPKFHSGCCILISAHGFEPLTPFPSLLHPVRGGVSKALTGVKPPCCHCASAGHQRHSQQALSIDPG